MAKSRDITASLSEWARHRPPPAISPSGRSKVPKPGRRRIERSLGPDYFTWFVYGLLGAALVAQLGFMFLWDLL